MSIIEARPVRVLLVEDSPSDRALAEESLAQGYPGQFAFTHADTLAAGMALARKETFDVLLLDLSLPDATGSDTFLRACREAPQLPIVVLTGSENEAVGIEAVRQGVQDYLLKGPGYGPMTARAIRYAIERKRTLSALEQAEAALQRERDQLEARVQERTAELTSANRSLQAEMAQRQQAEEAHRQVLRRLAGAEEDERGRISRELHDQLGQELTVLKLGLHSLHKPDAAASNLQGTLAKLEQLVERLMRQLHRLAWELRPSALDDLGLDLALGRYAADWSENTGITVDFHGDGDAGQRAPPECETALYRITQEAMTNIARHAEAHRVSILLERRPGRLSLIIEDDGKGFDANTVPQAAPAHGSLGLLGMRERVHLVGGTLQIESSPGAGTTLFVRLPLPDMNPQP